MGAMAIVGIAATILTGTLTSAEALSGFANTVVWLVVAAFFFAGAFIRTGLGTRIACWFVVLFGRSTLGLGYSLVLTDLVLSLVVPSNTARAGGIIFPILQSLARSAIRGEDDSRRRTCEFLTLTAFQGTIITSAMFLTAMVSNPLSAQLAANQGITITWGLWATAAVVPGFVSLGVIPLLIYRLSPPGVRHTPDAPPIARAQLASLGPATMNERLMLVVLLALLIAWILGPAIGLDTTGAAFGAVAILLLTGILCWDDVCADREVWNIFIWFGTLLMMASLLGQFGLTAWFSRTVGDRLRDVGWVAGFLGLSLTYFYSHYFFASITAHVSAMYAPFLAVALALGTPPFLAALVLAFLSNLFAGLTHYGTAPAPVFFGSGYVSLGAWWKVGLIVSVANLTIWLGVGSLWWKLLGLW